MHTTKPIPIHVAKRLIAKVGDDAELRTLVEPLTRDARHYLGAPIMRADLSETDSVLCIPVGLGPHVPPLPPLKARDGFAVDVLPPCILDADEYRALRAAHDARLAPMLWDAPKIEPHRAKWIEDRTPWRFVEGRDTWLDLHAVFRALGYVEASGKFNANGIRSVVDVKTARDSFISYFANAGTDERGAVHCIAWAANERTRALIAEGEVPAPLRVPSIEVDLAGNAHEVPVTKLEKQLLDAATRALNTRGRYLGHGLDIWRKLAATMGGSDEAAQ